MRSVIINAPAYGTVIVNASGYFADIAVGRFVLCTITTDLITDFVAIAKIKDSNITAMYFPD